MFHAFNSAALTSTGYVLGTHSYGAIGYILGTHDFGATAYMLGLSDTWDAAAFNRMQEHAFPICEYRL